MAVKFDNLDDVISKFQGTICRYNGKPVVVQLVSPSDDNPGSYALHIKDGKGFPVWVDINDPLFSYRDFNLGYVNTPQWATWWYRKPLKQYQQGLKRNQMTFRVSDKNAVVGDDVFGFTKNYVAMLSNAYPSLADCGTRVRLGERSSVAFHKDFALSFNKLHEDYTVEFRGKIVGLTADFVHYKLLPEYEHLRETLEEVLVKEEVKINGH